MKKQTFILFFIACIALLNKTINAKDWPKYQLDNQNSGVTTEHLDFPLDLSWQFVPRQQPNPAWPAPVNQVLPNAYAPALAPEQEINVLKDQIKYMQAEIDAAAKRIRELDKTEKK